MARGVTGEPEPLLADRLPEEFRTAPGRRPGEQYGPFLRRWLAWHGARQRWAAEHGIDVAALGREDLRRALRPPIPLRPGGRR